MQGTGTDAFRLSSRLNIHLQYTGASSLSAGSPASMSAAETRCVAAQNASRKLELPLPGVYFHILILILINPSWGPRLGRNSTEITVTQPVSYPACLQLMSRSMTSPVSITYHPESNVSPGLSALGLPVLEHQQPE
jgi:hypothetical protein